MKKMGLVLSIAMFFSLGAAQGRPVNNVTITADQVTSARDIEIFIENASNFGTRPAKITLDSSKGDFFFSGADRSINIYYPDITLTSKNGAKLANCGDGVFFDPLLADNITIEGITFQCEGLGVAGGSGHKNVTIRNNAFASGSFSIAMENAEGWRITGNHAQSPGAVIFIVNSENVMVINNSLEGAVGVFLDGFGGVKIVNNDISAAWQGIYLGWGSSYNQVANNRVTGVQSAGVTFAGANEFNQVLGNRIGCATGSVCQLVSIETPPLSPTNKVKGNKFTH